MFVGFSDSSAMILGSSFVPRGFITRFHSAGVSLGRPLIWRLMSHPDEGLTDSKLVLYVTIKVLLNFLLLLL